MEQYKSKLNAQKKLPCEINYFPKMGKAFFLILFFIAQFFIGFSQSQFDAKAHHWADSVMNSLTPEQRIAQLIVMRESTFSKEGPIYSDSLVSEMIRKYNIGGIVLFLGTPIVQANYINRYQQMAQTPLMVCIDGEWGLGMRFDSVIPLNHQMMLGAIQDDNLIYRYGRLVAAQCARMGIHVNYAPVVDVNNNPLNPVINDRSFGENKYRVTDLGIAYMHGLQDGGVLACAKHFPGHGDVSVDSHLDLPVIHKSFAALDSLELYPFKKMIDAGVGSVMVAHLFIPAIDSTSHSASSISQKTITGVLREKLNFEGLVFTDALEMKGVTKYFPGGEISVKALVAGNDILCLPEDIPMTIEKIKEAISQNLLSWQDIDAKCKKVLLYKYKYGMTDVKPIDTANLTQDLNNGIIELKREVAENAITLLNKTDADFFPLKSSNQKETVFIGIGISSENTFSQKMKTTFNADVFFFDNQSDSLEFQNLLEKLKSGYKRAVIGIHNYSRFPANQFGISSLSLELIQKIKATIPTIIFDFGNPYALKYFCDAKNLIACYEDDSITHQTAIDLLSGKIPFKGSLPVTVCENYPYGSGIQTASPLFEKVSPEEVKAISSKLDVVDSIALEGIDAGAFPGCVILAIKDGKVFYEKAFGNYNYDGLTKMNIHSIFDLASVTKITATTLAIMKLYEDGKIQLNQPASTYLPWLRNSNKRNITIRELLLHQGGLQAYIPFFKETIDANGKPLPEFYRDHFSDSFNLRVAENLYLRSDWEDSIFNRIANSPLSARNKYIYSDNDFILLGKIVESITGLTLDEYVSKIFYQPMGLSRIGFKPRKQFLKTQIVPTEFEKHFRLQQLWGDVHDPGAAMFGGVSGHAGLFADAENVGALMQMLLNGGKWNGTTYLKKSTINFFTKYNSHVSRRGLGFDKPEKDILSTKTKNPYPSKKVSPTAFGHTGYTGTAVWADPHSKFVFVFLSNRVNPDGGDNTKISTMNIRSRIQDAFYNAFKSK